MTTEAMQEQTETIEAPEEQQAQTEAVETPPEAEATQEAAPPEKSEDDAFAAGFRSANGEQEPEPEPQPEPVLIAGMTEEQIREAVAKAAEVDKLREQQSKLFGTLGSFKQALDQLRNQPKPTQGAVQITKDKFSRLSKEFPEMAELIAQDLSEALGTVPVTAEAQETTLQELEKFKNELKQETETKLLTVMHKDWKQVVQSQEFAQWTQSLSDEVRNELGNSWDAAFIGEQISEFKAWKDKATTSQQGKQRRLEAAITPKGGVPSSNTETETDSFMAGWKAVRGVR